MSTTPPTSDTSPSKPLSGLFQNSQWHCDCPVTPRLPAEHFKVKKPGPNHGRWFYTCQGRPPSPTTEGKNIIGVDDNFGGPRRGRSYGHGDRRCGFFLWKEDADRREMEVVLSNKTSEATSATVKRRENKRKRKRRGSDDDGSDSTASDGSFKSIDGGNLETPRKKTAVGEGYVTPVTNSRRLPWLDNDAVVVSKDVNAPLGGCAGAKTVTVEDRVVPQLPTPGYTDPKKPNHTITNEGDVTPTPVRFRDVNSRVDSITPSDKSSTLNGLVTPFSVHNSSSSTSLGVELTKDVISLLNSSPQKLPDPIMKDMKTLLDRYELRISGVVKGRDMVRAALKTREAKISELQGRIAGLEAERGVLRGALDGRKPVK